MRLKPYAKKKATELFKMMTPEEREFCQEEHWLLVYTDVGDKIKKDVQDGNIEFSAKHQDMDEEELYEMVIDEVTDKLDVVLSEV